MSSKKSTLNRSVAYSSFEHLHFAMVQFVIGESKHKNSTETCHAIIENMGFIAGQKSAERMTSNKPRFGDDHLDLIKVLCKEFWNDWFGKQVDHLRTNHRGTYVLTDNEFVFLTRMSVGTQAESLLLMKPYLAYPCGLIRGALSNMGIEAFVTADIQVDEEGDRPRISVIFKVEEK